MTSDKNPFRASMTTLWIPPHMSSMVSVGGFEVEAAADGSIEVPKEHVAQLVAHGLSTTPPASTPEAKKAK